MKSVLKITLLTAAFFASGSAMAQDAASAAPAGRDYPPCSKTVTDECQEIAQTPHALTHHVKAMRHNKKLARRDKANHTALAKPATPAKPTQS